MIDIDIDDDDDDADNDDDVDTKAEITTEPKVGALPSALTPVSSKVKTVVMSLAEVSASHRQEWPETPGTPETEEPTATLPADQSQSWMAVAHQSIASEGSGAWQDDPALHPEDEAALADALPTSGSRKGLLIAALLAVTALSLIGAFYPRANSGESEASLGNADSDSDSDGDTEHTKTTQPKKRKRPPPPPPPPLDKGTNVTTFLNAPVERILWDGEKLEATIDDSYVVGDAIPKKKEKQVSVVNFWATWCEPCKQEMPGLKKMFEESDWGDKVRFVPIAADTTPPTLSYEEFAPLMPAHEHYLVGPEVPKALVEDKVLEDGKGLPITLLLDCKRQMRWIHSGELHAEHVEFLEDLIGELRGELSTSYCKPKPRPPQPTTTTGTDEPPPPVIPAEPPGSCGVAACLRGNTCDRSQRPPKCVPN